MRKTLPLHFCGGKLESSANFLVFLLFSVDQPIQYVCSDFEDGIAKLTIQDALPEDDGVYTCLAENAAGKASCCAQVTVKGNYEDKCPADLSFED